jgi:hypothetical protein
MHRLWLHGLGERGVSGARDFLLRLQARQRMSRLIINDFLRNDSARPFANTQALIEEL